MSNTHKQETNRQAVYQHGSAFLGKGQPKIPRQLVTRGLNLKSGEGRIQNLVPEPAALGSGHAGLLLASSQAGRPLVRRWFLGSGIGETEAIPTMRVPLGSPQPHPMFACTLKASCLPFLAGGGLFLLFGCYRVHLLRLKPGGTEAKGW